MQNVTVRIWDYEKTKGAFVATVYATTATFALSVGPALLLCHSASSETTLLECTRYDRPHGAAWSVAEIAQMLQELREDDVFASPADVIALLPRLPNLNVPVATIVLSLIQGVDANAGLLAWSLTQFKAPRAPRPMVHADITLLREQVTELMHSRRISQERFAKQAGLSIATFAGFVNNTMDSREATLSKIRHALGSLQNT